MHRDALSTMEGHCANHRYLFLPFHKYVLLLVTADGESRKQHIYIHTWTSHEIEIAVDPCGP